jgi:hypothetical protein
MDEVKATFRSKDGLHLAKYNCYETVHDVVTIMHCTGRNRYGCKYAVKVKELRHGGSFDVFEKGAHNHDSMDEDVEGMPPIKRKKSYRACVIESVQERYTLVLWRIPQQQKQL